MISIYCLIDPRTGKPFYVGCTGGTIKNRLSAHITEIKTYHGYNLSDKQKLIASIIEAGLRPEAILLCNTTIEKADWVERFYYKAFVNLGFTMLQLSTSFFYSRKIKTESINIEALRANMKK